NSPIVRETYGLDDGLGPEALAKPIVDDAIPYDAVWDCVTCGACVEACPVLIEHVDKIVGLRRNLVLEESRFPAELTVSFRNMEQAGNPWGQPRTARLDWTRDLPFEVATVADVAAQGRLDELEVVYWVGCAAAFDERNRRVARAFATCLDAAAVPGLELREMERNGRNTFCCGAGGGRMWMEETRGTRINAERTKQALSTGAETVATGCPFCMTMMRDGLADAGRGVGTAEPVS